VGGTLVVDGRAGGVGVNFGLYAEKIDGVAPKVRPEGIYKASGLGVAVIGLNGAYAPELSLETATGVTVAAPNIPTSLDDGFEESGFGAVVAGPDGMYEGNRLGVGAVTKGPDGV